MLQDRIPYSPESPRVLRQSGEQRVKGAPRPSRWPHASTLREGLIIPILHLREIDLVHQFHDGADGRIEMEPLDILCHLLDRFMGLLIEGTFDLPQTAAPKGRGFNSLKTLIMVINETPDPIEEPGRTIHPLVTPVQILLGRRGKETEDPCRIRPVLLNQILRVNDISFSTWTSFRAFRERSGLPHLRQRKISP